MKKINKKGFTLIELLVVIAIIGILASVVLASLNSARAKSRDARRIADVKQLQLALELYADANNQAYPADINDLLTGCSGGTKCIAAVPAPPAGAQQPAYTYDAMPDACTTDCTNYHLGGVLEEISNQALLNDVDSVSDGAAAFDGTSVACDGTAGTPAGQADNTEACYDITD